MTTRNVVFEGDSITYGFEATTPYPTICQTLMGLDQIANVATSGNTLTDMLSQAATEVDPLYDAGYDRNIAVLMAGRNDISDGRTSAQIYADIIAWCQGRRAAGFEVIIHTILPRVLELTYDPSGTQAAVNALIRANWATFADGLCDCASDSLMSPATYEYYPHGIHPSDAGYAIIADWAASAIYGLELEAEVCPDPILIRVGTTSLYDAALASEYDDLKAYEMGERVAGCLADIGGHKWLANEPLSIDHYTAGRATAGFVALDLTGAMTFYERQMVIIESLDEEKYFAGLVQSCESVQIPGTSMVFHTIDATDFTAMLDWRLIDYAAEDQLAGDAVRAIMEEYLAEEGITEGYIANGELLTQIALANCSAATAYTKLAEACNFICYLDYDLKLYFHARTAYAADWNIADGTDILSESLSLNRTNPDYRNKEVVVGGFEETSLQTETFVTDGTTKTFALGYPVNRVSTVTVNGAAKTVGIKGTDSGSYDCYYAVESETLTFEEAPASGTGTIEYYGLWKAKSVAEDLALIAANAVRQGVGSGKVEHVTVDDSLTSVTAAGEYANAKIVEYGVDGITCSYKTRRSGLAAGTLQHITIQDVDEDFLITHVSEELKEGDTEYSVTACFGPVAEEWDQYFRQAFDATEKAISEGVSSESGVAKLFNFTHVYAEADRPNPFTLAKLGLRVDDDSWPCFERADRTLYIEFWKSGACIFRKQHTTVPDIGNDEEFNSYSFVSPAEAIGDIDEVVFWGGDTATATYGSGVELYRAAFVHTKTGLESYQVNMEYLNGAVA
jgi:lysophospholipase L1-like esterase